MFNKGGKKFNRTIAFVLNSKTTYILLIIIILIQFLLVSIIFLQNKKSKYLIEQTNFKAGAIENRQIQMNKKINSLQSQIMIMSSRMYRTQGDNKSQ